jgi:hypothetical protein
MPITEHALKTERHTTFFLAAGPENGPLVIARPWLAGVIDQLATSTACTCSTRVSHHRARHAWVWAFLRVSPARGVCPGTHCP